METVKTTSTDYFVRPYEYDSWLAERLSLLGALVVRIETLGKGVGADKAEVLEADG